MKTKLYILWIFYLLSAVANTVAQVNDLGTIAYSTLKWDHFAIAQIAAGGGVAIGLTTDKRIYVTGQNNNFIINTLPPLGNGDPVPQFTFKFVPSPAGETVKKVDAMTFSSDINGTYLGNFSSFGCLTESGKLYVWGFNNGLLANAFPVSTVVSTVDTTKAQRTPVQLSIPGETAIVDFDMPNSSASYWAVVGASGKAYVIGKLSGGGAGPYFPSDNSTTFYAISNPVGVGATFKYTKVWASDSKTMLYLKGNDGNIYFAGSNVFDTNDTGVPELFTYRDVTGFIYSNDGVKLTGAATDPVTRRFSFRTTPPYLVPFPAGEDIVKFDTRVGRNTLALSASGKAYATGSWKYRVLDNLFNFYRFPLKNTPINLTELHKYPLSGTGTPADTTYYLKKFVEVAVPLGASKVTEFSSLVTRAEYETFLIVGDNKKAYWSGTTEGNQTAIFTRGNYFDYTTNCKGTDYKTLIPYSWEVSAPLYYNTSKIYPGITGAYLISSSNTGYIAGNFTYGSGAFGRTSYASGTGQNNDNVFTIPTPIGNELLDACNANRGSGGNALVATNTAVGVIDCSKTQLSPAPTAGTASQLDLIVSINVTTAGTFTPITVSGSGMTVANGITSVSTATTGIQTFHIPMNYDGTALATLNFTIGSAGSCTADLSGTTKKKVINEIWTLDNCTLQTVAPDLK